MGIPRLFYFFYKHYPHVLVELHKSVPFPVDILSYDLNARIHPICQKMVGYGSKDTHSSSRMKPSSSSVSHPIMEAEKKKLPTTTELYHAVCSDIEELRAMVRPSQQLVIAIDGPSGLSKMNQQRQRRFRTVKERDEKDIQAFDSNKITSGSVFMYELSNHIQSFIHHQLKTNPDWNPLGVVFSNERHAGEGEHKIVRYFSKKNRQSPGRYDGKTIFIHSPDADLIMLALGLSLELPKTNLYILRENMYDDNPCSHFLMNISKLKETLFSLLLYPSTSLPSSSSSSWNPKGKSRPSLLHSTHTLPLPQEEPVPVIIPNGVSRDLLISDFILMCFLLGNDFLPHSPAIEILLGGLELLFECYASVLPSVGHLTFFKPNGPKKIWCIHTKAFQQYLYKLSTYEHDLLVDKAWRNDLVQDKLLVSHFQEKTLRVEDMNHSYSSSFDDRKRYQFKFSSYRQAYYQQKMHTNPEQACRKYFEGMMFVLRYYLEGMPDWEWTFPFFYSPFLTELYPQVVHFDGEMEFHLHSPLTPIEQLWAVLPLQSQTLLPPPIQDRLKDQRLSTFYPSSFHIDVEGTRNAYEGVICLPSVDIHVIRTMFTELYPSLSSYDKTRNKPSKLRMMRRRKK